MSYGLRATSLALVPLLPCFVLPTRADGGDPPPVLSWLKDSAVIGGHNVLRLQSPPGKTFRAVVWEIDGAIAGQVIDEHGFTNTPLPSPLIDRPPGGSTEAVVGFYWDGRGGSHSIAVTVEYTDGTVGAPDGVSDPAPD